MERETGTGIALSVTDSELTGNGLTLVYFWSMNDYDRAREWAGKQEGRVGLRKGQRWKGEIEPCDRVVIFGPLFKIERAYKKAGVAVEAEDILPDYMPEWVERDPGLPGANTKTIVADLGLVEFASSVAENAARNAELSASDFVGVEPSGKNGYTKPDVDAVIAAREA